MDAYELKILQRKSIKSKKEILDALDDYSSKLVHDNSHSSDGMSYRPALIELIDQFKKKIQRIDLAYLEQPLAAYEIVITNVDICLNTIEYAKISFDDNNEIESAELSICSPIVCVDFHFIDIAEFAQRFSIDIETTESMISDRKIKCAKKGSSGWQIIETQNLPSEESTSGDYVFIGESGDLSSIAPLCEGTQIFSVFGLDEQNSLVDTMSFNSNDRLIEHRQIAEKELRHIEDALIRSQDVLFVETLVEVIDEKVIPPFKSNPFLTIPKGNILRFVDQLDLPTETKNTLKAMAKSERGENLFITTLEQLSKKDVFLKYINRNID